MAITLAKKGGFGRFFYFFILGILDVLKPLEEVFQPSKVICTGFGTMEVLGATKAQY